MSSVYFTGQGAYIPEPMGWLNDDHPNAFSQIGISSATRKIAMIGMMTNATSTPKYIKSISFRTASITKGGSTDVEVSIQGLSTANVSPNGIISGVGNNCKVNIGNANLVANTWINVADFNEVSSVINSGQGVAVVFAFSTFNAGDLFSVSSLVGTYLGGSLGTRRAYHSIFNGASWTADASNALNVVLNFSDGTYGTINGSFIADSVGSITYNNTSAVKEVAMEFIPPFEMIIDAMWLSFVPGSAVRDYTIKLWENDIVLDSITYTAPSDLAPLNYRNLVATFNSSYILSPTKTYRISHKAETAGDQTVFYYGVNSNNNFECAQFGKNLYYNTYDGSVWGTPITTRRLWGGVRICGISQPDTTPASIPTFRTNLTRSINNVAKILSSKIITKATQSRQVVENEQEIKISRDQQIIKIAKSYRSEGGDAMPVNYETRLDDTSTAGMTYVGRANVGVAGTSTAVWQISRIDRSSGLIVEWADGNDLFDNIWDNRTSLSYS